MPSPYRVVDLFAGCGGITEGFRLTGRYVNVAAVELEVDAASTYAENFGEDHIYQGSIVDWLRDGTDVPEADVVVGGPPCQGFSNLGARLEDDPRNELWREYVRVLALIRPKAFLIENVPGFLQSRQFTDLEAETEEGGSLADYVLEKDVLVAADFGSAQVRRRAIVIGTRRDLLKAIEIPSGSVAPENRKTVRQALRHVRRHVPEDRRDLPKRAARHFGTTLPGPFKGRDLHVTRFYEDRSLERFAAIPPGGNRFDLPEHLKAPCWIKHTSGSGDVMGRLWWDRPSVTIRTEFHKPEKGRYLHPTEDRAITHLEAARLQGFGPHFKWCGTKDQIARQIGNAVPVELAQALGKHIAEALDDRA
ncbi:DNA cytosine methyltransferase [Actinoplanes sp. NEAU-A12]|uniref:Cytosine-specific methyltransferase n=1 Tax=Actinoplanes sandaracinus TaxID=3045177 RepID=A0ABT6WHP6_9ACTN|nr:DNA cytosine methyltransferase [Actinoplanes sandaracinus]MDI6099232.1 DNA cytosine methyltransferase [Actinoplanes sandaracinus]